MKTSLLSAFLILAVPFVSAWGRLGHETVALLAQSYLLPGTIEKVQTLLNDTGTTYLANVALWADNYRYTAEGAYTSGFHYIDGTDGDPPESCIIDYATDCPEVGGCITARLADESLQVESRAEALRFIIHFLGDITQPLHTEALGAGGNSIKVTYHDKSTNLHAAWDTSIPNEIVNTTSPTLLDSLGWANIISAKLNHGPFRSESEKWLSHHRLDGNHTAETAAAAWAQASNELVCEYALREGAEAVNGTEIGDGYYREVRGAVEESIAIGGVRLAGWLNLIFEGRTGFGGVCFLDT
ncbi:hypothetical protein RUND412_006244 [Rhizina undulata]